MKLTNEEELLILEKRSQENQYFKSVAKSFRLMKVFDCQQMPQEVRDALFKVSNVGNDCAIEWYLDKDDEDYELLEETKVVQNWLLQNGASYEDDSVMIKHWW